MIDPRKFKASTIFRKQEINESKGSWVIAVDIGCSSVKVMSPVRIAAFPSLAVRVTNENEELKNLSNNHITYVDLDTGEKWIVGQITQEAISEGNITVDDNTLFGGKYYESPLYKVLVRVSLAIGLSRGKNTSPNGKRMRILLGYPPIHELHKENLQEVVSGRHHFSIKVGTDEAQTFDFKIIPDDIFMEPALIGSLMSIVIGNNGHRIKPMFNNIHRNCIILDCGFDSLTVCTSHDGHLDEYISKKRFGMHQIMKELAAKLKGYRIPTDFCSLQNYLEEKTIVIQKKYASTVIPLRNRLEQISEKICHESLAWLSHAYRMDDYDYLIITGGLSDAWKEIITEEYKNMSTLQLVYSNEQSNLPMTFSNVRGLFYYGLMKSKQIERSHH